ncbi:hypothetical protein WDH52_23635 [Streptomyces sp. TRM70308]|uniref:hypothetical protein n=1 Tax=Streptomyces sp. TRM70308 TaxID=3131932 RepID=UPI003CFC0477
MAKFVRWLHDEHEVPMRSTVRRPYPASYGTGASQRLSAAAFNSYYGHLGTSTCRRATATATPET